MAGLLSRLVCAIVRCCCQKAATDSPYTSLLMHVQRKTTCRLTFGLLASATPLWIGFVASLAMDRADTAGAAFGGGLVVALIALALNRQGASRRAAALYMLQVPAVAVLLLLLRAGLSPLDVSLLAISAVIVQATTPLMVPSRAACFGYIFSVALVWTAALLSPPPNALALALLAAAGMAGLAVGMFYSALLAQASVFMSRAAELESALANLEESHEELEELHRDSHNRSKQLAALNDELLQMQFRLEDSYKQMERMNQQLHTLATTDGMTGIPNHRQFQEMLRKQMDQAIRYHHPLSLILLDVDNFKQYNDAFGHPAGDVVLKMLAEVLVSVTRAADIPARYGGEEFAIILPNTNISDAAELAERIRTSVEATTFPARKITVSLGVSTYPEHGTQPADLIAAADRALYTAKSTGRNGVAIASLTVHTVQGSAEDHPELACAEETAVPVLAGPDGVRRMEAWDRFDSDCLREFGGIEGLLQQPCGSILQAILAAIDARDQESSGHFHRVARYALRLAEEVSSLRGKLVEATSQEYLLTPGDYRDLAIGSMLHDIGKLHIPERVLAKRSPLTEADWRMLRAHPIVGAELVSRFTDLAPAALVIRNHHERWDGKGYPDGKREYEIPLVARIFAICDTYDALTSDLPFRRRTSPEQALAEIRRGSGTQFDPFLVELFVSIPVEEWVRLSEPRVEESKRIAA